MHSSSHHDYETNRSTATTTLLLSRRGNDTQNYSDVRSSTPLSQITSPQVTQISTPSMKAMVPLCMDELQQASTTVTNEHSSSTESAHEHYSHDKEIIASSTPRLLGARDIEGRFASSSSPFNAQSTLSSSPSAFGKQSSSAQHLSQKFVSPNKPSKIPLPGSKSNLFTNGEF